MCENNQCLIKLYYIIIFYYSYTKEPSKRLKY